jgi:DNA repair exonuclease SbcCD ATPase subunit
MPVTAKLSRKFYERFGDDLTNELVEWFNQVDATYHSDLRELNELNFARFDAKLEQRTAQLDAKLEQRTAQLDAKIEQRTAQIEARIDQRVAQLEAKMDQRMGQFETALARVEGGLLARMNAFEGRLIRMNLVLWVATLGTLVALLKL